MSRKEWREVSGQCLYFVMLLAGIALLIGGIDLVQGRAFESEKFIIMLGLWLLSGSLFLGLSPFALDGKQRGLEYLLTLPLSRRRLLLGKFLPRLAAVVIFYLAFVLLYSLIGNDALGGGYTLFSLIYFALFFISFSLALVHENFIVQFIWAGVALCGYLALCLYVVGLGFSWKFRMPGSWAVSRSWQDLAYDGPTLLAVIAVFLLLAAPFVISLFLAFKKFDLKPARVFNRRQLLVFVPLLLLAFVLSLGITYFVQRSSPYWEPDFFILKNQRVLKAESPGKMVVVDQGGRSTIDAQSAVFWDQMLLEDEQKLYLSGYDTSDGAQIIACLDLAGHSLKIVHRAPDGFGAANAYKGIRYDGRRFVYLRHRPVGTGHPGKNDRPETRSGLLELVCVDPAGGGSETITFRSPLFRRYSEPWLIGSDERNGKRFWLVASRWRNVFRLWQDGRAEDLGVSGGLPVYAGGLLFMRGDRSLKVLKLLDEGSETVKEIAGEFKHGNSFFFSPVNSRLGEIYAERDKRIVRIDLATFAVEDVGPSRGHIRMVAPGDFYYVEFESWPGLGTDRWKKLYRLQDGKMVLLKRFDFADAGYGHLSVNGNGVILNQARMKNSRVALIRTRVFAFPDLKELPIKD